MYQSITFVGNLGHDPELRQIEGGKTVTNIKIACNRKYRNPEGRWIKEKIWFNVSAWGPLAQYCVDELRKGNQVLVEGTLIPDPITGDPKIWSEGTTLRSAFDIHASKLILLSSVGAG